MAVNPKIVKYFIKSSPVGEVGLVLKDLCQIIESSRGHFEAIDADVEEDNADGENDVEEIAVLVISQMP